MNSKKPRKNRKVVGYLQDIDLNETQIKWECKIRKQLLFKIIAVEGDINETSSIKKVNI